MLILSSAYIFLRDGFNLKIETLKSQLFYLQRDDNPIPNYVDATQLISFIVKLPDDGSVWSWGYNVCILCDLIICLGYEDTSA